MGVTQVVHPDRREPERRSDSAYQYVRVPKVRLHGSLDEVFTPGEVNLVPPSPGVYFLLDSTRRLLYVGKATSLRRRLHDHSRTSRWRAVSAIGFEPTVTEAAALAREAAVLAAVQTPWNKSQIDAYFSFVTRTSKGLTLGREGRYGVFPHLGRGAMSVPGRACIDGFDAFARVVKTTSPDARLVHLFLTGQSDAVLRVDLDCDQPHVRHGIERDRFAAGRFYEAGPKAMRRLRLRHAGRGVVTQDQYIDWIKDELTDLLGDFR